MRRFAVMTLCMLFAFSMLACEASKSDSATDSQPTGDRGDTSTAEDRDVLDTAISEITSADSSRDDASEPDREEMSEDSRDEGPDTTDEPEPQGSLTGTWAQRQVQSARVQIPVIGPGTSTTTSDMLVTITHQGDQLLLETTICDVQVHSGTDLVQIIMPRRFLDALPTVVKPATLNDEGGEITIHQPAFYEVRGALLTDVESEALPTTADDGRVIDLDGDVHPGFTVRVTGLVDGEMYVIQRASTELSGLTNGTDRWDGYVTWTDEQVVLGTDNPILNMQLGGVPDDVPENNVFQTTRIENGADCTYVTDHRDELFAR